MLDTELIEAARQARESAYAPYSGYKVGAAILDELGKIHIGCNVENVSYGGCICAERHAIGAMVVAGGRQIKALAVATLDGGPPCGICLQSIQELGASDTRIILAGGDPAVTIRTLGEFMPFAFASNAVRCNPGPE